MTEEAKNTEMFSNAIELAQELSYYLKRASDGVEYLHAKLKHAVDTIESLSAQLEQVTRERDAAVEDIKEAAKTGSLCYVCTHNSRGYCKAFEHGIFDAVVMCGQYKWRGVEVEE